MCIPNLGVVCMEAVFSVAMVTDALPWSALFPGGLWSGLFLCDD